MRALSGFLLSLPVSFGLLSPLERQVLPSLSTASSSTSASGPATGLRTWPEGVQIRPSYIDNALPLVCGRECVVLANAYYYCFINTTLIEGPPANSSTCNYYICNNPFFNQLSSCLNCYIANGDERPNGYQLNTSLTGVQPVSTRADGVVIQSNPNGLLNLEQANGWLKNVSDRCSSIGTSLSGVSTITAIPTTTGPYYTSWTINQTLTFTTWTGLTQYTSRVSPLVLTGGTSGDGVSASAAGSGASTPSSTGSPTSRTSSSATSSAAASRLGSSKWFAGLGATLCLILA